MTIEEMKEAKKDMEKEIVNALSKFTQKTGLFCREIDFEFVSASNESGETVASTVYGLRCRVEL
jgi:hypothetical protein